MIRKIDNVKQTWILEEGSGDSGAGFVNYECGRKNCYPWPECRYVVLRTKPAIIRDGEADYSLKWHAIIDTLAARGKSLR